MKNLQTYEDFLNESSINESMYGKPTKDSSITDHYGKTVKQVLEDEDGLNSYLTIQFKDNTQMIITAYPTGSGGVELMVESLNEKFVYPEGVKTTGDKILDKTAKLLHSSAGTITIGTGSVRGQKIPFSSGPETFLVSVSGEKYTILCGKGDFEIPRKEIKNAEELYDQIEKAIQMGTVTKGKLRESVVNEGFRDFSVDDFPIGAEVTIYGRMGNEVWKVVKPGNRGGKVFMAPFDRAAKDRYISMAIEFDLSWLNGAVEKIEK